MNKKIIVILLLILISLLIVINLTQNDDDNDKYHDYTLENKTTIEISYSGPYNLNEIIHEIKTNKDYDNDTVAWMESLSQKNVFLSNNSYVIMNNYDAGNIHHNTIDITDVNIVYNIECYIVENRSLGSKNAYDIILVENVTYLGNKTYFYEV